MKEHRFPILGGPKPARLAVYGVAAERDPLTDVANPRHRAALALFEPGYEQATTADDFRAYLGVDRVVTSHKRWSREARAEAAFR